MRKTTKKKTRPKDKRRGRRPYYTPTLKADPIVTARYTPPIHTPVIPYLLSVVSKEDGHVVKVKDEK